ncbi:MAG TPA: prephenate dehydratase [Gemmatimonadaceae bacterium]|nr:prephenate dehydratase [Gemmatimonadaceae bacterium]
MAVEAHVAFLGPAGTFTHEAARVLCGPNARYDACSTIDAVFDAVRRKDAPNGVVPIENSTEGSVTQALDCLLAGDVRIAGEMVLDIVHCLASHAATIAEIERVYSHPQALAQCRRWLAANVPQARLVDSPSTAAAVRHAAGDHRGAAIGSRFAAALHGVPVLHEAIQDAEHNATRFALLAPHDAARTGDDKTTIAFAVHDERGALLRVLEVFDENRINLSRIESRPSKQRAWDYVFIADLEGHRTDGNVARALTVLEKKCPMLKNLGSYPRFRG